MSDSRLATTLAAELEAHLRARAGEIPGPVYALSLWSESDYGSIGLNIATEATLERIREAPAYRNAPDDVLTAPAGIRWNSGDWDIIGEGFVTESTQERLNALAALIDDALGRHVDDPSLRPEVEGLLRRWQLITNEAFRQTRPLALLDSAPDAVTFVEFANFTKPVEVAMSMTLTVEPELMRRLFPHWGRLSNTLTSIAEDPDRLVQLREQDAAPDAREDQSPLPPEMQRHLDDCGFTWRHVAKWSGARVPFDFDPEVPNSGTCDPVALVFVVVDRIG
jgi:hypothetical protein